MLKALEIAGFKSFADRTRFDFPPGITVVVGPNGSGKSNVVDAIKWVLGEQSAKSLRGKEMSDVIFKGGGSSNGRRPGNTAEATIVLDNVGRRLDCDTDEVHVTRRVFRSGEGEYLINGDPCRLKDIRELFRGTGIGTDAYSLIEQGKVDRLLQASPRDRRAIFEEAAGISRFKAKKVEAQRRLARVDQNLLRLSDIVEEVGSRYRSVKAQASKASRYKEHSDRLRQLRIELSYVDWRDSENQVVQLEAEEKELAANLGGSEEDLSRVESELGELQEQVNRFSDLLLELESDASGTREGISRLETTVESEGRRQAELEERQAVIQVQLEEVNLRIGNLSSSEVESRQKCEEAAEKICQRQKELEEVLSLDRVEREVLEKKQALERQAASSQEKLEKEWADQQRRSFELETESNALGKSCDQAQLGLDAVTGEIQQLAVELNSVETAEKKLQDETARKDQALAAARKELQSLQAEWNRCKEELQDLKTERSGVVQRVKMIEELEKRFEGVQSGAKSVLDRAREEPGGPFAGVFGLVADLIQVQVQHASLVDGILGEWSQFVVCDGQDLTRWLAANDPDIAGRVGVFRLMDLPKTGGEYRVDLSGRPGVVGRADQVVTVADRFQPLVHYLLGNVWIVQSLRDSMRLREELSRQVRYVTLAGEIVEPDGSLIMGPPATEMSLISRRSELRSLKKNLLGLDASLQTLGDQVRELGKKVRSGESAAEQLLNEHTHVSKQLAQHQLERENLQKQLAGVQKNRDEMRREWEQAKARKESVDRQMNELSVQMKRDDEKLQDLVAKRSRLAEEIESGQQEMSARAEQQNHLKLELATEEKNREGLEATLSQMRLSRQESEGIRQKTDEEFHANRDRIEDCVRQVEQSREQLVVLVRERDELTQRILDHSEERRKQVARREQLQEANSELTTNVRNWQARQHKIELDLGQLRNLQDSLEERLRDDYGLDLREISEANIDFVIDDREAAESEVESLKRKIVSIGAVNTDALKELEDLEGRYLSLEEQFQDLVKAKESLERIIVRINTDSRKIFVETLEAIRENFQALYRRNFGGGKADIVLEEGVDELEAGIDIVATPPGKAEFSNSLLSGGEKALTAVSLLLAIFQFRPSPFCVLDEVDAPFDEANIGRFVEVLKGFLSWTRFVVVTHSKKTMTAADTLYGVTMLESGVSTKVSVRFEDVDEKGNISRSAVDEQQSAKDEQGVA
ncbi:MAG: chromosome segregation protein SMC [Planctomycetota bacterium]|nr:chromosome segregation protein SMC [Planctomycetota bacterium]